MSYVESLLDHKLAAINFADSAIQVLESQDTLTIDILYSYRYKSQNYQHLGDFYRANVALEMALYIANSLNQQRSGVLVDLGSNKIHIGDLDKAEEYFKTLLADKETSYNFKDRIIGQANLTDLYLDLGKLSQANEAWKEVQLYLERDGIEEDPLFPDFLQIKAHLQQSKGQHQQSITTLRNAIDLLEKQSYEKRKAEKFRCDLIELLLEENIKTAQIECKRAYHYFNEQDQALKDPYQMVATHLMARVFYEQYRNSNQIPLLDSSLFYCKKAQEVSDLLREGFLYRNSKYQLAEYLKANIELGLDVSNEIITKGKTKKRHDLFFYFLEKGKSQVLLDELDEKQQARLIANGTLEKLYLLELKEIETIDSIENMMLNMQIEKVKSELKQGENEMSNQEGFFYSNLDQLIQLSKQSNTVFLEFGEGKEYPYVFMINDGQLIQKQIAVSKDSLERIINRHHLNLKNPRIPVNDYASAAYQLYTLLLEPLAIKKQDVVIIPSTLIASLPFASLVTSIASNNTFKSLSYALEEWNFSYAFSSAFLTKQETEAKQSFCGLLSVNQIEGDLSSHENLMSEIAEMFGGVYFQKEMKLGLSRISEQHDFIHISSHGTFSRQYPSKSYLYMPGSDSSKLTIEQLYSTTMSRAPFVVLNACETGEGEVRSGEGMDNFTRAFFYSGASGVVESSWKINADQTATIFDYFYQSLLDGKKTKEALRAAQLTYLKDQNTDDHFAHPYYWAGFRHFGAAVALKSSSHEVSYWLITIIGIAFLVLGFVWWSKKRKSQQP